MGDKENRQQFCLPGLQGFPVQITGWEGLPEKRVIPNDITLQFTDTPVQITNVNGLLNISGSPSGFFLGGTKYQLRGALLTPPSQLGLKSFSAQPLAEFQLWGVHFNGSSGIADGLGVVCIPLRMTSDLEPISLAAKTILDGLTNQPIRLADCVPAGPRTSVVRYSTCVEVENRPSVSIQVAYWSDGAFLPQQSVSKLPPTRSPIGIPNIFNGKTLSAFELNEETKQKTNLQFRYKDSTKSICEVYPSKVLSATSTEVSLVFGVIQGFKTSAPRDLRTTGYKCIAIDRMRDIQDGRLVVDPATGQRLDEVVKEADEETKEIEAPVPKEEQVSTWRTVAIVLGVFLGLSVLALLIYFAQTFFVDRKSTDLPDVSEAVQTAQKYTNSINEAPASVSR